MTHRYFPTHANVSVQTKTVCTYNIFYKNNNRHLRPFLRPSIAKQDLTYRGSVGEGIGTKAVA